MIRMSGTCSSVSLGHLIILARLHELQHTLLNPFTHRLPMSQAVMHLCTPAHGDFLSFLYTWTSAGGGGVLLLLTGPSIKGSSQVGSKKKPVRRHRPELHTTVCKGGAWQHSTQEKYCIPCSLILLACSEWTIGRKMT